MKIKIDRLTISKKPIKGITKSPSLWGHEGSVMFPLIYFRKPKWVPQEYFDKVIEGIELNIKDTDE